MSKYKTRSQHCATLPTVLKASLTDFHLWGQSVFGALQAEFDRLGVKPGGEDCNGDMVIEA